MTFATEAEVAKELAKYSARATNLNKGSHPYDLPDQSSIIRGEGESGIKAKWDTTYHPEEGTDDAPNPIHERTRGGGIGAGDLEEVYAGNSDPEFLHTRDEKDEDFDEPPRPRNRIRRDVEKTSDKNIYNLSVKPGFWEEAPKDVREFYLAWTQKGDRKINSLTLYNGRSGIEGIGIHYNSGEESRQASFYMSDLLKWFNGVEGYHEYGDKNYPVVGLELKSNKDKSTVIHPETDPHKIYKTFSKIRLENIRLPKEAKVNFEGAGFYNKPERVKRVNKEISEIKVDPDRFNQKLHMPALDKFTIGVNGVGKEEAEENRKNVLAFHKNWVEKQDGIRSINFETNSNQSEITSVVMKLQNAEVITVPAWLFRQVFVINRYQGKGGIGLEFVGGSKIGHEHISPKTTEEELENIMSKVNIDGVSLKRNVRLYIGSHASEVASG